MTRAQKPMISPKEAIQSRGTASQPISAVHLMLMISGWVASSVCVNT